MCKCLSYAESRPEVVMGIRVCVRLLWLVAAAFISPHVKAESLRCSGGIVDEGDSRISVLYKCGQPLLADSFCAPVYYNYNGRLNPVPEPFASIVVPCQQTDEWLYNRGDGNLMATVRIRSGRVLSIKHGREPQ
jgi:hypothetical protein